MPLLPGIQVMPVTLLNAALGLGADRSLPVRGPDRIAVVSPMFDEEEGAGPALASLLEQWHPVDEIAISINGGSDATPEVVARVLRDAGYRVDANPPSRPSAASVTIWTHPPGGPPVTVLQYDEPTSKAASINALVTCGYLTSERVLVVDGDTRFDPEFVRNLRDSFYRLRLERPGGRRRYVLEDVALQSGAARSLDPGPGRPMAAMISRARTAEYGLACLIRRGQTRRLGRGRLFGSTRMYTAVGCGFAARRDIFPIPADTQTEDHDFTLAVQNGGSETSTIDPRILDRRGFRIVLDGREVAPRAFFDPQDEVVLRRGSDSRFVAGALMYTEDPPRMGSYVRQVERWTGGGVENVLKRVFVPGGWRSLRANVRFAALGPLLENVLGLLLLMLIPAALGLHAALPDGGGLSPARLGMFLAVDFVLTTVMVLVGLGQIEAACGYRGRRRAARVARSTLAGVVPLFFLKYLNILCFLAAATKVVPAFCRRREEASAGKRTWARARSIRGASAYTRLLGVTAVVLVLAVGTFTGMAEWVAASRPGYGEAWRRIHGGLLVEQNDHRALPLATQAPRGDGAQAAGGAMASDPPAASAAAVPAAAMLMRVVDRTSAPLRPLPDPFPPTSGRHRPAAPGDVSGSEESEGVSAYCRPGDVAGSAPEPRSLAEDAPAYRPLNAWQRLMLARLAPLATHLDQAATAYDVDPHLLLAILLNESYLDPLAVGPTDDLGLSQVTSDTLSLLHSLSADAASPLANARLFDSPFSVFDPDFSICAGAAKLAWARSQPGGENNRVAYARYINPLHGVVRGRVSQRHEPLVQAIVELAPMVDALSAALAAHRADPSSLEPADRALLDVTEGVAAGELGIAAAYRRTYELVGELSIDDAALYERVLDRLFDLPANRFAGAAQGAGG